MSRTRVDRYSRAAPSRRRTAFQRIDESLERERERRHNDPEWMLMDEEKLTRLRLALFGSAPK